MEAFDTLIAETLFSAAALHGHQHWPYVHTCSVYCAGLNKMVRNDPALLVRTDSGGLVAQKRCVSNVCMCAPGGMRPCCASFCAAAAAAVPGPWGGTRRSSTTWTSCSSHPMRPPSSASWRWVAPRSLPWPRCGCMPCSARYHQRAPLRCILTPEAPHCHQRSPADPGWWRAQVQHPAAKLIVYASQAQEQEIGDGSNFVSGCFSSSLVRFTAALWLTLSEGQRCQL